MVRGHLCRRVVNPYGETCLSKCTLSNDLYSPKIRKLDLRPSQTEVLRLYLAVLADLALFGIRGMKLRKPCFHLNPPTVRALAMSNGTCRRRIERTGHFFRWPSQQRPCNMIPA